MKVTLVTPLKNERQGIEKLWEAVCSQTRPPDEWIIMDNGSTDGTDTWLEERGAQPGCPVRVRVLRLPGLTIARMMNRAIGEAGGDVIAGCHGGTRIPREWLERLLAPMAADPGVDVSAGTWEPYGETEFEKWLAGTLSGRDVGTAFDEKTYLPATRSIAFKKEIWRKVGGFPEWLPRFGEDTLFAIKLRMSGCKFVVARDARVGWRPKPSFKLFFRQERLYTEAGTLMGLFRPGWRYWARPWFFVTAALWVSCFTAVGAFVALLAMPLLDYLRLKGKGASRFGSFKDYFFWMWLMPMAYQSGWLNARRMEILGGVRAPEEDRAAVEAYSRLSGAYRGG